MKKWILSVLAIGMTAPCFAQELPQPSPTSTVQQRIGLTDVSVNYSRPSVNGRDIFGDLVPYDQLWRTGANGATKISFSNPVIIEGRNVDAGEYALFTIPNKESWTLILSKQSTLWGIDGYDKKEDIMRIAIVPEKSDFDETFSIGFKNLSKDGGKVVLEWSNVAVSLPIEVDSEGQSAENVSQALSTANRAYRNAARYYSETGDHNKAMVTIDLAIELDGKSWYTNWIKAEILQAAGKTKEAKKQGNVAIDIGQSYYDSIGKPFHYRADLEKNMKKW